MNNGQIKTDEVETCYFKGIFSQQPAKEEKQMNTKKKRSACGISSTLDILGDKWSLLVIRDMIFFKKKTYGEFLQSPEKIATNILADRLNFLELAGIIVKKEFPGNKSKILYELTQKGIDLLPILLEIMVWSDKYLEVSERGKALTKRIITDREGVIKDLTEKLSRTDSE